MASEGEKKREDIYKKNSNAYKEKLRTTRGRRRRQKEGKEEKEVKKSWRDIFISHLILAFFFASLGVTFVCLKIDVTEEWLLQQKKNLSPVRLSSFISTFNSIPVFVTD